MIIKQATNAVSGLRYQYVGDGSYTSATERTRNTNTGTASPSRYTGSSVSLYAQGEAVAVSYTSSGTNRGGVSYLGKDILGSVKASYDSYGVLEERYEYDAFGTPYKGDLSGGMNYGYTGKPYDATTGMYNYGYRDYSASVARFTTVDPVRDGNNWFAYVNNDPVQYVDPDGRIPTAVIGGIIGFVSSAVSEVSGYIGTGKQVTVSSVVKSVANVAVSTAMGALTSGLSSIASKAVTTGMNVAGKAIANVAINTVAGAVDASAKSVASAAINGQSQNWSATAQAAVAGAAQAAIFSGATQGLIGYNSANVSNSVTNGSSVQQPSWTNTASIAGEMVAPAAYSAIMSIAKQGGGKGN